MDRFPIPPERRRRYEARIRIIDMVGYLAVLAGGVYALFFTPDSVTLELAGWPWLVPLWSSLLLIGGLFGFAGRVSRYWVLEMPATVAAIFGIAIYFVILWRVALTSVAAAVATVLVFLAMLLMLRRYLELQIFSTDPGEHDLRHRVEEALRRRTKDVVSRTE